MDRVVYVRFSNRLVKRTEDFGRGAFVVDYDQDDKPVGIKILIPAQSVNVDGELAWGGDID